MKYRLGDICTITKGETGIMKAIDGAYTMVTLGEANKTHNAYQFDTKAVIIPLVSSTGHGHASMKRVKYQEGKFALGSILCAVIPKDENFVLAKYLHIYLHWNREELLVSQMKGMANVSLPMNKIADVIVTVPSLEKQKEIVELEKKLVEKELEADKLYTHQLTLIENLNQAILQEAVQGKLVPQDPTDEPASQLLERIKAEKAKTGKKEKPLPPIKPEEIPFEIPDNWVWCRLGEIINFISGNNFESTDFFKGNGVKCIKITNAGVGQIIETDDVLPFEFLEKYSQFIVNEGDLILALTRPYISTGLKISICPPSYHQSLLNQRVAVIRPISGVISSFLFQFLSSSIVLKIYQDKFDGQGQQPNLKKEDVTNLFFPLPPLSEQQRIVAEIEKQLSKTKELKAHIIANQQATEQLLKALLHGAFEVEENV
ncbi:restriction modification system DNA specificity domain-containing protein [Emticicia oligotrophica DSM 17448]|uniref:Restriction modification system DNA specificity domain-containing protein n=1 Tax=Emticicia oligotrophica (strain DSM 17448 / CIP 109782 / MTCC 6937 / GPTSA100-15) TaxID=929562 RepID=A0ABN4AKM8_EMTOG|nr:restriction endonuclease subunit S [Emticicia oligotrophica]AFK02680.1 restriction modification system DNA specificity domain-containing protein [Emticicia oligotrophica DSM 17448]